MKHVMIQYRLKPDAGLEELRQAVREFVRGLRETSDQIHYLSYQQQDSERSFVHVGAFPDESLLKHVQAQPFFAEFSDFLRPRCEKEPSVTWLGMVASTYDP